MRGISAGGVLAAVLGCAALAGCNEKGATPNAVVTASDSADQVLFGFVHFLTRDGVREGQVEADTAFFYDPSQTTVLKNMTLVFIDSTGKENATITSRFGTYKWQTGNMTADSNVVLRSHDGRVLKTEKLLYDATTKQLSSDLFFTFDNKEEHLQGDGFKSDLKFEHITVTKPTGEADKGIDMPGQGKDTT